ncbi:MULTISPECIES: hypothetical protein [unclassified Nonomuraea]|uniref:hypothetical protein n=1 Tax=unclassified Nonomuraea TaxID=2593643 RepID=UPI0035BF101A
MPRSHRAGNPLADALQLAAQAGVGVRLQLPRATAALAGLRTTATATTALTDLRTTATQRPAPRSPTS